jgi:hypothetical protein
VTNVSLNTSRQYRRGPHDDRRRRLLLEEVQGWEDNQPLSQINVSNRRSPPPHYGDAPFMDEQKRLIDLIPRRLSGIGVIFFGGLGVIAGLIGLHHWTISATDHYPEGAFAALNLAAPGNLAQWCSSLLLLAATGVSLLVYSIRRQRNDDYQGRYRVWLWAALCWFIFATDVSVSLNRSLQLLLVHFTGTSLWKDGALWWIVPYTVVFAALGSRLVLDMGPCRLAIAAFALATMGYVVALLTGLGLLPENFSGHAVMVRAGAILAGHLALLLAMILQARYSVLDFEGLLPERKLKKAKPKRAVKLKVKTEEEPAEADSDGGQWHRIDSPQGTPQPVLRRAGTGSSPVFTPLAEEPYSDDDDDDPPNPTNRKLTKQEKKALKARLLRERAEREKKQSKW